MLCKVWATEAFADEPDRIGVIEAENLAAAIEMLKAWNSEDLATTADYEELSGAETTQGPGYASVTFRLRDVDGNRGQDSYMLVPHEGPLMFLAEDWRQVFS
jgi:hypothetical protein